MDMFTGFAVVKAVAKYNEETVYTILGVGEWSRIEDARQECIDADTRDRHESGHRELSNGVHSRWYRVCEVLGWADEYEGLMTDGVVCASNATGDWFAVRLCEDPEPARGAKQRKESSR